MKVAERRGFECLHQRFCRARKHLKSIFLLGTSMRGNDGIFASETDIAEIQCLTGYDA